MKSRDYPASVVRVIDGDTIVLTVDTGFRCRYTDTFRLYNINAPEGKTLAGALLSDILYPGREVIVTTYKPEKYGRWLADIAVPEVCTSVCEMLIKEGLVVEYFGGKR